jgi:hypothetical protein
MLKKWRPTYKTKTNNSRATHRSVWKSGKEMVRVFIL